MSTTTKDPPRADERGSPTWEDVADLEERVQALRERRSDLATREAELREEKSRALAAGEDADELAQELREVRSALRETGEDLPALEALVPEWRMAAAREDARARISAVKRSIGGLCGEAPRRIEKAEELLEALTRQLEWLAAVETRRNILREEAALLAARFGLDVPDLRDFDVPAGRAVTDAKRAVRAVHGLGNRVVLSVRQKRSGGDLAKAARTIAAHLSRHFDEETPTPGLIDSVAEPEPADQG